MTIMYLLLCYDILAAIMHNILYNLYVCKLCFDNKLLYYTILFIAFLYAVMHCGVNCIMYLDRLILKYT